MDSFYFYDLETSGVDSRNDRVMQFAGQRTNLDLEPIGEPDKFLIKLTKDTLPEPEAIMITGITPQATRSDGLSEAEFLKYFQANIAKPRTTFVGFNNIRFDDEFMRFMLWRNFYDAYEWQWKDGSSRWDILDVSRITRALRPDGINWPYDTEGKPTNRLEYLSSINKLEHESAHDALSDVNATIALAKLIKSKQPKIFNYLLSLRDKKKIEKLTKDNQIFVYSSGRYPSEYQKTTLVTSFIEHPEKAAVLVYDLRINPEKYINLSPSELLKLYDARGLDAEYFPFKVLQYNRCPAIAPVSVLDKQSINRLKIDMSSVESNFKLLKDSGRLADNMLQVLKQSAQKYQTEIEVDFQNVDSQLYSGFVEPPDKTKMSLIRSANRDDIKNLHPEFNDRRLATLFPLFKARNFPNSLNENEQIIWDDFCKKKLLSGGTSSVVSKYFDKLELISKRKNLSSEQEYILQELKLYGESILPTE